MKLGTEEEVVAVYTNERRTMNKEIQKIICFVLIISLSLAGLYVDTIAAASLFVCDFTGKTASCLRSCHADNSDSNVCTEAMLNECSGMELEPLGKYPDRDRETGDSLNLLYSILGFLFQGKSFPLQKTIQFFCLSQNELLTDYIHQSDGKKRI